MLPRSENYKLESPLVYGPVASLISRSLTGDYLLRDPATHLRLIANHGLEPLYKDHARIACDLGLELIDSVTGNGVAVCGYDVLSTTQGLVMQVVHTPQGRQPPFRQRGERRRLLQTDFRMHMMQGLQTLAYQSGLSAVTVVAAINHPKVKAEAITLERGFKIIDDVATSCGFDYGADFNLWWECS